MGIPRRAVRALLAAAFAPAFWCTTGVAAANTVEAHWDTLGSGGYHRAGDYTSDFSPADASNGVWQLVPTSGPPEIGFVKLQNTGSGHVEVHIDALSGSSYKRVGDYVTDFSPADAQNGDWQLFGSSGGAPELGLIKLKNTGSGTVEVHLDALSSGAYHRVGDYTSDFSTADAANGTWQLIPTSGAPELGFIKELNTGSGHVEVHIDALSAGTFKRTGDYVSDFSPADAGNGVWQLLPTTGAPELGFVKFKNTGSGTVEVHLDTLGTGGYTRVVDAVSDFSPADAANGWFALFGLPGSSPELGFVKTWPPATNPSKPAAPVQTVVTKQTLPVPAANPGRQHARHHRRRHIRARFTIGWTWNHRHTRLVSVYVTGLPRNGTITIRCQGRGCTVTAMVARRRRVGAMLRSLQGRVFRAGDAVLITVSAPGRAPERIALRIRDGREPAARLL